MNDEQKTYEVDPILASSESQGTPPTTGTDEIQITQVQNTEQETRSRIVSKKLIIMTVLVLIALCIASGTVWWYLRSQLGVKGLNDESGNANELQFYGNTVPRVACDDVKSYAKDVSLFETSKDKYQCYKQSLVVDSEKITYVKIQLTPEFKQYLHDKRCAGTVDCGYAMNYDKDESVNTGEYIVRSDGTVENYTGTSELDSLLKRLTGCGDGSNFGIYDELKTGTLIIDKQKVGSLSNFSDIKVKDSYGNSCMMNLEVVSYITDSPSVNSSTLSDRISIKKIEISYALNNVSTCSSQSGSGKMGCYSVQAAMRSDPVICENLAVTNSSYNSGFDDCIIGVAEKMRDPQLCNRIRYYREQLLESCQEDVTELGKVYAGKTVTL